MAAKPTAKPAAAPAAAAAPEPKKGFPILLVLGVLLGGLAIGGGVAWFVLPKPDPAATPAAAAAAATPAARGPAQYVAIEPAFVVNLADEGSTRYLQTELQVMTRDPKIATDIGTHLPAIRNALLMLFSKQTQAELRTTEGREKLQNAALAEVNRVLKEETGNEGVEALFFTSFVTQ